MLDYFVVLHTITGDRLFTIPIKTNNLSSKNITGLVSINCKPYSVGIIDSEKGVIMDIKSK